MISRRGFVGFGILLVLLAAAGAVWTSYARDMAAARDALVIGKPQVIASRFGDLEFAIAGTGKPLLMIHGAGGGYDQSLFFAQRLVEAGYQVIAPSRFGYLGSALPADASSENQADAFVDLLDHLQIANLPVIGGSAGALSAVQLAIRHPERVTALIPVVPIGYYEGYDSEAVTPPLLQMAMVTVLRSDFLFWLALTVSPDAVTGSVLATDPELVHSASTDEQARIAAVRREILPVSERARGIVNDTDLSTHPYPVALEAITAPTLIISSEDDKFGTAAVARELAAGITGTQLLIFPEGGHVYVGHDAELFAAITAFLASTEQVSSALPGG